MISRLPRLVTIPIELYRQILEQLDPRTEDDRRVLLSLLTASCAFKHEAERVLYREIHLHARHVALVEHLKSCPRLAKYVQHLYISSNWPWRDSSVLPRDTLAPLTQLKYLTFTGTGRPTYLLDYSHCHLHAFTTNTYLDASMWQFLSSQHSLCEFHWDFDVRGLSLDHPLPDLPGLQVMSAATNILSIFLPGRSIRAIHINNEPDVPEFELEDMLQVPSVQSLRCTIQSPGMSAVFPFLRYLELSQPLLLSELVTIVQSFSALQHLAIRWKTRNSQIEGVEESLDAGIATSLFTCQATLLVLEFERYRVWKFRRGFEGDSSLKGVRQDFDEEQWKTFRVYE